MPHNTAKDSAARNLLYSFPGGIEAMESEGQQELVKDDTLPSTMNAECRTALEKAGVVFKEAVADDPLFLHAVLPKGWRKVGTDHDMWSRLVDDQGNIRARIFYKAAFYDRKAKLYPPK